MKKVGVKELQGNEWKIEGEGVCAKGQRVEGRSNPATS